MRHGFGFNTNLLETNVLNLRVVVRIVVKVVGDALRELLDQRRQTILSTLQEADKKKYILQQQLDTAKEAVKIAHITAEDIRSQSIQTIDQENYTMEEKLKKDLEILQQSSNQAIKLERQRAMQSITQQIISLALKTAENKLISLNPKGPSYSKQKELNNLHVKETFRKLKARLCISSLI
jgi:F-type H+-transporting ATPase subunit b